MKAIRRRRTIKDKGNSNSGEVISEALARRMQRQHIRMVREWMSKKYR